ncbi:uncharacterized protein VP01_604g5 [Puccinia sorghi]|uniref:Myb/SANT-like domain-containing protein n=1 Tax=Puccinia sorghi TaxID=27349 RepID=A0A0L6UHC3_9BASI|nr:uncharacterized protein VP01_604g5 [Puccinia sorghi]
MTIIGHNPSQFTNSSPGRYFAVISASIFSSLAVKTTPRGRKVVKLFWMAELEQASLKLYVQAVRDGKRSNNGFKPETHCAVAILKEKFLHMDLDEKKLNLKTIRYLSFFFHSFFFFFTVLLTCHNTSGFGWNDETSPPQINHIQRQGNLRANLSQNGPCCVGILGCRVLPI